MYACRNMQILKGTDSTGKEIHMKKQAGRQNARTRNLHRVIARSMFAVLASVPLVISLCVRWKSNSASADKYQEKVTVNAEKPITAVVEPAVIEVTPLAMRYEKVYAEETEEPKSTGYYVSTTLEQVDSQEWLRPIGSKYKVSKSDFVQLCNLVGREYGSDFVPEKEKALVAMTVLNRVDSEKFPNTIEAVISQPDQYVGELSRGYYSEKVTESVREAVMMALNGEIESNEIIFYWGDGCTNHFYTYEEYDLFEAHLNAFKDSQAAIEE